MSVTRMMVASLALLIGLSACAPRSEARERPVAQAPTHPLKPVPQARKAKVAPVHRIAIQVAANDPALMTLALNNAADFIAHHKVKGEKAVG